MLCLSVNTVLSLLFVGEEAGVGVAILVCLCSKCVLVLEVGERQGRAGKEREGQRQCEPTKREKGDEEDKTVREVSTYPTIYS
jgi:hypothetical protein